MPARAGAVRDGRSGARHADVLKRYVPAFHPAFLGLTGSPDEIARAAKEFKIFYQKQNLPSGGYSMDHSAGTYILDAQGGSAVCAIRVGAPRCCTTFACC